MVGTNGTGAERSKDSPGELFKNIPALTFKTQLMVPYLIAIRALDKCLEATYFNFLRNIACSIGGYELLVGYVWE